MRYPDERLELVRAVCTTPDDDLPRRALADWLARYGDDGDATWAELIWLQLAPGAADPARELREAELIDTLMARWLFTLDGTQPVWERGMVTALSCTPSWWLMQRRSATWRPQWANSARCSCLLWPRPRTSHRCTQCDGYGYYQVESVLGGDRHPVTRVHLTNHLPLERRRPTPTTVAYSIPYYPWVCRSFHADRLVDVSELALTLLSEAWPGVRFSMAPV